MIASAQKKLLVKFNFNKIILYEHKKEICQLYFPLKKFTFVGKIGVNNYFFKNLFFKNNEIVSDINGKKIGSIKYYFFKNKTDICLKNRKYTLVSKNLFSFDYTIITSDSNITEIEKTPLVQYKHINRIIASTDDPLLILTGFYIIINKLVIIITTIISTILLSKL